LISRNLLEKIFLDGNSEHNPMLSFSYWNENIDEPLFVSIWSNKVSFVVCLWYSLIEFRKVFWRKICLLHVEILVWFVYFDTCKSFYFMVGKYTHILKMARHTVTNFCSRFRKNQTFFVNL
jgi:hypothetical protein